MERKYNIKNGEEITFGWVSEKVFTGTVVARPIVYDGLVLYPVRQTEDRPVDKDFECVTVPEWAIRSKHETI